MRPKSRRALLYVRLQAGKHSRDVIRRSARELEAEVPQRARHVVAGARYGSADEEYLNGNSEKRREHEHRGDEQDKLSAPAPVRGRKEINRRDIEGDRQRYRKLSEGEVVGVNFRQIFRSLENENVVVRKRVEVGRCL
jgi:hypothetical protein